MVHWKHDKEKQIFSDPVESLQKIVLLVRRVKEVLFADVLQHSTSKQKGSQTFYIDLDMLVSVLSSTKH